MHTMSKYHQYTMCASIPHSRMFCPTFLSLTILLLLLHPFLHVTGQTYTSVTSAMSSYSGTTESGTHAQQAITIDSYGGVCAVSTATDCNVFRTTGPTVGAGSSYQPYVIGGMTADRSGGVYFSAAASGGFVTKWIVDSNSQSGGTNRFRITNIGSLPDPTAICIVYASSSLAAVPGHADLYSVRNNGQLYYIGDVTPLTVLSNRVPSLVSLPGTSLLTFVTGMQYFPATNTLYAVVNIAPGQLVKMELSSSSLLTVVTQTAMFNDGVFDSATGFYMDIWSNMWFANAGDNHGVPSIMVSSLVNGVQTRPTILVDNNSNGMASAVPVGCIMNPTTGILYFGNDRFVSKVSGYAFNVSVTATKVLIGADTTMITLMALPVVPRDITIYILDNGAGGTVNPSVLSFAAGESQQSFYYSPPGVPGVVTLSFSSTGTDQVFYSMPPSIAVTVQGTLSLTNNPPSMQIGSITAAMQISPNPSVPTDLTVTPSDGSSGGTFTPAFITFTTGQSASISFTYKSSGQPKALTITFALSGTDYDNFVALPSISIKNQGITTLSKYPLQMLPGQQITGLNITLSPKPSFGAQWNVLVSPTDGLGASGGTWSPAAGSYTSTNSNTSPGLLFAYTANTNPTLAAATLTFALSSSIYQTKSIQIQIMSTCVHSNAPTVLSLGATSSPITVTLQVAPVSLIVTMSDNGAGGTFTGNPITFNGFTTSTWTYKASSSIIGPVSITTSLSSTDGNKFLVPAAINLAVKGYVTVNAPTKVLVGADTTTITLTTIPAVPHDVTITVSDGGAGGTLHSSSLAFAAGESQHTFYYTAPSTPGVISLAFSSTGSDQLYYALPSPIAITVQGTLAVTDNPVSMQILGTTAAMTITPSPLVPTDLTITPSDGGSGGSFDPADFTFGAGETGGMSFTYTSSGQPEDLTITFALSGTDADNFVPMPSISIKNQGITTLSKFPLQMLPGQQITGLNITLAPKPAVGAQWNVLVSPVDGLGTSGGIFSPTTATYTSSNSNTSPGLLFSYTANSAPTLSAVTLTFALNSAIYQTKSVQIQIMSTCVHSNLPTVLALGATSSPITISLQLAPANLIVTLSDSGAGGTFSDNGITFSGTTTSTWTYQASSTQIGPVSITTSLSGTDGNKFVIPGAINLMVKGYVTVNAPVPSDVDSGHQANLELELHGTRSLLDIQVTVTCSSGSPASTIVYFNPSSPIQSLTWTAPIVTVDQDVTFSFVVSGGVHASNVASSISNVIVHVVAPPPVSSSTSLPYGAADSSTGPSVDSSTGKPGASSTGSAAVLSSSTSLASSATDSSTASTQAADSSSGPVNQAVSSTGQAGASDSSSGPRSPTGVPYVSSTGSSRASSTGTASGSSTGSSDSVATESSTGNEVVVGDSSTGESNNFLPPPITQSYGVNFEVHMLLSQYPFQQLVNSTKFQLIFREDFLSLIQAYEQDGSLSSLGLPQGKLAVMSRRVQITAMSSDYFTDTLPKNPKGDGCVKSDAISSANSVSTASPYIGWARLKVLLLPSPFSYVDDFNQANITDILLLSDRIATQGNLAQPEILSTPICTNSFSNVLLHTMVNITDVSLVPVHYCVSLGGFTSATNCEAPLIISASDTSLPADSAVDDSAKWRMVIIVLVAIGIALCCVATIGCWCSRRKSKNNPKIKAEKEEKVKQQKEAKLQAKEKAIAEVKAKAEKAKNKNKKPSEDESDSDDFDEDDNTTKATQPNSASHSPLVGPKPDHTDTRGAHDGSPVRGKKLTPHWPSATTLTTPKSQSTGTGYKSTLSVKIDEFVSSIGTYNGKSAVASPSPSPFGSAVTPSGVSLGAVGKASLYAVHRARNDSLDLEAAELNEETELITMTSNPLSLATVHESPSSIGIHMTPNPMLTLDTVHETPGDSAASSPQNSPTNAQRALAAAAATGSQDSSSSTPASDPDALTTTQKCHIAIDKNLSEKSKVDWLVGAEDKPYIPTAEITRTFAPKPRMPVRIHSMKKKSQDSSSSAAAVTPSDAATPPPATVADAAPVTPALTSPDVAVPIASDELTLPAAAVPAPAASSFAGASSLSMDGPRHIPASSNVPSYEQLMELIVLSQQVNAESVDAVPQTGFITPSPELIHERRSGSRPGSGRLTHSRGGSFHAGFGSPSVGALGGGGAVGSSSGYFTPPRTPRTGSNSAFATPSGSPLSHRTRTSSPRASGHVVLDMSLANTAPGTPLRSSNDVLLATDGSSDALAGGWASPTSTLSAPVSASPSGYGTPSSRQPGAASSYSASPASYHSVVPNSHAARSSDALTNSKPKSHRQLFKLAPTMNDTMQT